MRPPAVAGRVPQAPPAMRFVEAGLAVPACQEEGAAVAGPPLPVHLPCGARLLVADERQAVLAARILEALASGTPC